MHLGLQKCNIPEARCGLGIIIHESCDFKQILPFSGIKIAKQW